MIQYYEWQDNYLLVGTKVGTFALDHCSMLSFIEQYQKMYADAVPLINSVMTVDSDVFDIYSRVLTVIEEQ